MTRESLAGEGLWVHLWIAGLGELLKKSYKEL
jgi:hypothetical protein